jgi:23S rRNA pseudouridine955/2504/2580 synthase
MQTSVQFITVLAENAGQRLDNFLLTRLKGLPKSHLYRLIRKGEIRINKKRCDVHQRLETDDLIRLPPMRLAEPGKPIPVSANLTALLKNSVLFENAHLMIINKPAGLAVHGGSGVSAGLIEQARQVWPEVKNLELVHRLDRDTSGCLILAKKPSALKALHSMLRDNQIEKMYFALVKGYWPAKLKILDAPLQKHILQSGERMVKVQSDGQHAETHIKVKERFSHCTLVEVLLKTGRTHQIRVHTQHAGFPIMGDEKYGDKAFNKISAEKGLKRLFLHAYSLRFQDPVTGEPIAVTAPLDKAWESALTQLRGATD